MKKIAALILVLVLLCGLTACDSTAGKLEALCGRWEMATYLDAQTAQSALEALEFYPEEIALLDLNSMRLVKIVEFNTDRTYRFAFDADKTVELMEEFYRNAVSTLYSNREQLAQTYGEEILEMTQAEFEQYYARLFSLEDYDALIRYFLENALDYGYLERDMESGTFRVAGENILCTIEGEEAAESMGYSIEGDTLTLVYGNGEEVYTKAN